MGNTEKHQSFILYSLKHQGFWLKSGIYGSDWTQAQTFSRSAAVARCKAHVDHDGKPGVIMIDKASVEEALAK